MPTVERHSCAYLVRGRKYGPSGLLVQSDWDFPAIACELGWNLRRVQRKRGQTARHLSRASRAGCPHRSTDGTVTCNECGTTASEFIMFARAYLDARAR
jgi:hypothetical protein